MTQDLPAPPLCEVIILTALAVEYQAVIRHLQQIREVVHEQGTIYHWGYFVCEHHTWRVAVAEIGMHGPAAAVETERAIALFRPVFAFFVGVAGGLKDVQIGDVVAATKVYGYEAGKAGQMFELRPELWRADHALEQRARVEARDMHWLQSLGTSHSNVTPRVLVGPIAAGERVVASQLAPVRLFLHEAYGDALAVEMEGHGFSQAVHVNQGVRGLVIRGISDLIDGKAEADASGSQQIAALHAAAFTFQILAKLTMSAEHEALPFPPKESQDYRADNLLLPVSVSQEPVWNVPLDRNPFFTGREQELDYLYVQLHQYSTAAVGQKQSVSGLGGIGKTQLVVEYAYRHRHEYDYVLWARADSVETLNTSYIACAALLDLPEQEEQEQDVVQAVKRWFQSHQKWLLILDNADEPGMLLPFLLPDSNGHLLLTTRASNLTALGVGIAHSLEMAPLPAEQSAHFLLQRANLLARHTSLDEASLQDRTLALQIAQELGNLPLALDQAGAYLQATGTSMTEYLSLYQQRRPDLLKERRNLAYPDSVATTWNLSFARVEARDPAAAELLRVCALLALDTIPEEVLTVGASFLGPILSPVAGDAFRLSQAMEALHAYSLVRRNPGEKTLTIHRLVRAVLQDAMEEAEQHRWAERATQAVNAAFPVTEQGKWQRGERLLPQALAVTDLIERYQVSSAEAGHLLHETASYLSNCGRYAEAEPLYQRALRILAEQEHPDVATPLGELASLYREQGKYAQAEPLYQQALRVLEQQLGFEHPNAASPLCGLAELYQAQGKYVSAEALYQQALRILEQQLGLDHANVAYPLCGLASLYQAQEKYAQASQLYQRALYIREQLLGPEHPDVAYPLCGLANLYYEQGQYLQAEPLYQRALRIWERQLGPEHPLVASPLNNLALLYQAQGKGAEAEPLYQRALYILERQLDLDHPFTRTTRKNYISLVRAMGRDGETKKLEEV